MKNALVLFWHFLFISMSELSYTIDKGFQVWQYVSGEKHLQYWQHWGLVWNTYFVLKLITNIWRILRFSMYALFLSRPWVLYLTKVFRGDSVYPEKEPLHYLLQRECVWISYFVLKLTTNNWTTLKSHRQFLFLELYIWQKSSNVYP